MSWVAKTIFLGVTMTLAACGGGDQQSPKAPVNDGGTGTSPIVRPPTNRQPNDIPTQQAVEDYPYQLNAAAAFPAEANRIVEYRATGLPAGISINPQTGEISGTTDQVGVHDIVVTAVYSDGEEVDEDFQMVVEGNDSPRLTSAIADQNATQGQPLTVSAGDHFQDPESGDLRYEVTGLPSGMSFDADTGEISGSPTTPGDYVVTVAAIDPGGARTEDDFLISVAPAGGNASPQVQQPIEDQTAKEGEAFALDISDNFSDPEGGDLTFTATGLPSGMTLDPNTGVVSGTPDVPGDYTVVVTATDPSGASVSDSFDLTVNPADYTGPVQTSNVEDQSGAEGVPFDFQAGNHFEDSDGGDLSYAAQGLPAGLSIDPDTGAITGTPSEQGTFPVTLTVTDADGQQITETFNIVIGPNQSPELASEIPDQTGTLNAPFSTDTAQHFNDPEGQALTYSATGLPAGMSIDPQTGEISGTPTEDGDFPVTVTATDPNGGSVSDTFDFTVGTDNQPPELSSEIEDEQAVENYPVEITTAEHFNDPEGQPLSYTAEGLPDGLSIDPDTGLITGSTANIGVFNVTVTATDAAGDAIADTFVLDVEQNDAPTAGDPPQQQRAAAGQNYENDTSEDFNEDPEGGELTYSASDLPPGLELDSSTGVVSGVPTTPGEYSYTVTATDPGGASAVQVYPLSIAPALTAEDDLTPTNQNTLVNIDVLANDDIYLGAPVEITAITVQPTFGTATVAADGQSVNYTPFNDSLEDDYFEYQISDGLSSDSGAVDVFIVPARVVYRSNVEGNTFQLYQANSGDPENPLVLTPPPVPAVSQGVGAYPNHYIIDDVNHLAYVVGDQLLPQSYELFVVDLNAESPPDSQSKVSQDLQGLPNPVGDVEDAALSPDKTRVVYRSDDGFTFQGQMLYLVDVANPGVATIVHQNFDVPLSAFDPVVQEDYKWLPDNSAVVFRANAEVEDKIELYVSFMNNLGSMSKINTPLPADGEIISFLLSPNSDMLVYRANDGSGNGDTLHLVDLTQTLPNSQQLPGFLESGGLFTNDGIKFTPDGMRLVYRADNDDRLRQELYVVDVTSNAAPVRLVSLPDTTRTVDAKFAIDSVGRYIYFLADINTASVSELFRVDIDVPGVIERVSGPGVLSDVRNFELSSDDQMVVYAADHDQLTQAELYLVQTDALESFTKLNSPFSLGADVRLDMKFTRDDAKIIYIADPQGIGQLELYVVDFDFPERSFRISQAMNLPVFSVLDFHVTQFADLE